MNLLKMNLNAIGIPKMDVLLLIEKHTIMQNKNTFQIK